MCWPSVAYLRVSALCIVRCRHGRVLSPPRKMANGDAAFCQMTPNTCCYYVHVSSSSLGGGTGGEVCPVRRHLLLCNNSVMHALYELFAKVELLSL